MLAFKKLYTRKLTGKSGPTGNPLLDSQTSLKVPNRHTDKMECGLCWENFKMTDEVFNCQNNHVFHTNCYEDRALDTDGHDEITEMLASCPTCNSAMNISLDQMKVANSDQRYSINKR